MKDANYWIEQLELLSHPEGGYYKEIFRSKDEIMTSVGKHNNANRSLYTSIYFLLTSNNFSSWHKIKSDELWHWHAGTSLTLFVIHTTGKLEEIQIGDHIEKGEKLQVLVEAGCWFASVVNSKNNYSLVGCTVIPGFSFEDFELANANKLTLLYPKHEEIIKQYCR